jgi:nucleoside-diphosphate kinase
MRTDLTFSIIKPDSVKNGNFSEIHRMITGAGFKVIGIRAKMLTDEDAQKFYSIHKGKSFYDELISFMTSGEIYVLALQKDNAVEDFRTLIGDTDPSKSPSGTIRQIFGESVGKNAIHGADSDENAKKEILFFFPELTNKYDKT